MAKTQTETQNPNKPVFFEANETSDGKIRYTAKYGDLKVEGITSDKTSYVEIVERIINAPKEPPAAVQKMVEHVTNYVATAVAEFGSTYVSTNMVGRIDRYAKLMLRVSLDYMQDKGTWGCMLEATFYGRDGRNSEGTHIVERRIELRDVNVEVLRKEIGKVAKHAYNAYSRE
jgi:hypothetical protein